MILHTGKIEGWAGSWGNQDPEGLSFWVGQQSVKLFLEESIDFCKQLNREMQICT